MNDRELEKLLRAAEPRAPELDRSSLVDELVRQAPNSSQGWAGWAGSRVWRAAAVILFGVGAIALTSSAMLGEFGMNSDQPVAMDVDEERFVVESSMNALRVARTVVRQVDELSPGMDMPEPSTRLVGYGLEEDVIEFLVTKRALQEVESEVEDLETQIRASVGLQLLLEQGASGALVSAERISSLYPSVPIAAAEQ